MSALRRIWGHPALLWACRLLVGLLFIFSSFGKLSDPAKFLGSAEQYQLLPHLALAVWAGGLPGVEMLAGLLLLFSPWWRASALLLSGLFLVFIAALISVIFRHMEIDCSCMDIILSWAGVFGQSQWLMAHAPGLARHLTALTEGSHLVSWGTVLRDVYFLIPSLLLAFAPGRGQGGQA